MISFLTAHWRPIAVGATWAWSRLWARLRSSLPALGTPNFFRVWAYDFVKGNSAAKPPV